MDNIKISANFVIPGRVMYSEESAKNNKKLSDTVSISVFDKSTHKKDNIKYQLRKCKPCTQSINMTHAAYNGMINTPCNNISPKHWQRMSINNRIAEHLKEIQHNLNAESFEFTIFED